jgi:hypothetical protein
VVFDESNVSQVKQYYLDIIEDEESPCDALRRMVIGDVRPQDPNKDKPTSNEVAPPTQENDQNHDVEQNQDQEMVKDQGELSKMRMLMIKMNQDQHHHTQESNISHNVITLPTTFLVTSKGGNP